MNDTLRFQLEVPEQNLNHLLSEEDRRNILHIFKKYKLEEVYDPEKEIVISCRNLVEEDGDIHTGHKLWKKSPEQVTTPGNLPRLEPPAVSGARLHQLSIDYIDRQSTGFFSRYGYIGYYLSVIADLKKMEIIDARGEIADE
ncbi:MAG: hypothetical protein JXD23_03145 [Spirochaetales bacterium]|nr:hypothetical protein [Spirochaetales bacterium]